MGDLAAEGMAILMISSELPELLGMCDPYCGHARWCYCGISRSQTSYSARYFSRLRWAIRLVNLSRSREAACLDEPQ